MLLVRWDEHAVSLEKHCLETTIPLPGKPLSVFASFLLAHSFLPSCKGDRGNSISRRASWSGELEDLSAPVPTYT